MCGREAKQKETGWRRRPPAESLLNSWEANRRWRGKKKKKKKSEENLAGGRDTRSGATEIK